MSRSGESYASVVSAGHSSLVSVAFEREVTLNRSRKPVCWGRTILTSSNTPQGPSGLWALTDLAFSSRNAKDDESLRERGAIRQGVPGDPLSLDEVEMTVRASLETSADILRLAMDYCPGATREWRWGAHLWGPSSLDEHLTWPQRQLRQDPLPDVLELSHHDNYVGDDPALAELVARWIEDTTLDLGLA